MSIPHPSNLGIPKSTSQPGNRYGARSSLKTISKSSRNATPSATPIPPSNLIASSIPRQFEKVSPGSTITPNHSQTLRHKLAHLRDDTRALAHMAEVLFTETGKLIEQLGSSGQTTSLAPNSASVRRQVIENGRKLKISPAALPRFLRRCKADLVVDLRERPQVRLRHGKTSRTILLDWADAPILRVGLNPPGSVFGHRLLRTQEDNCVMSARSLTHRIAALTKAIQGGGTEGPFIQRVRVELDISTTKWGYRFAPGPHYVLLL